MRTPTRDELVDMTGDEELLFADGFDDAILGVGGRCGQPVIVVYDRRRCIKILMERDGMSRDDAEEHFSINTEGAWVGERTPLYLDRRYDGPEGP